MKYKLGDEICLRAKITSVHEGTPYPYFINICIGDNNWICDEYACQESAIVNLASGFHEDKIADALGKCSCLHEEYGKYVCYGTKEREECSCEGNTNQCNFYPEKKADRPYVFAELLNKGVTITADLYRETLNNIQQMLYTDILQMMGWLEYEAPLNRESCIVRIIEDYTPKGVVDAYEKFKHNNTVNIGDVIYLESDKREYIVTKIENGSYSMIAKDGHTTHATYQNHLNTIPRNQYKKIESNVDIKSYLFG